MNIYKPIQSKVADIRLVDMTHCESVPVPVPCGAGAGRGATTLLNRSAWGICRAVRRIALVFGWHRLASHPLLSWYDNRRELADLRAYKIAAQRELDQLKEQSLADRDSLRVQGDYLRTLEILQGIRVDMFDPGTAGEPGAMSNVTVIRSSQSDEDVQTYSCRWIEGGMSFVPGHVRVCPNCHSRGGAPGLVPFPDSALPVEDILRKKQTIRQGNQLDAFDPCTRCAYREKKAWPEKEHAFDILCLSHATACNLACDYCHTSPEEGYLQNPNHVPPLIPAIGQLIADGHLAPDTVVQWGGGEPTILREFNKLFTMLEAHGAFSEVYSSGVRVSQVLMEALARDTSGVMVSLDAGTPETYRDIKGRAAFDRVIANVRRYARQNSNRTILKMILLERNLGEVRQFLDIAESAGVRIVCFDTPLYQNHVDNRFIDAAALFCDEAERRGLDWRPGEVGLDYNPADQVLERINRTRTGSSG